MTLDLASDQGLREWVLYLVPQADSIEIERPNAYTTHVKIYMAHCDDPEGIEHDVVNLTAEHLDRDHEITCSVSDAFAGVES